MVNQRASKMLTGGVQHTREVRIVKQRVDQEDEYPATYWQRVLAVECLSALYVELVQHMIECGADPAEVIHSYRAAVDKANRDKQSPFGRIPSQ